MNLAQPFMAPLLTDSQPEFFAHLLGFVLAAIGVLAIWIVVIEWRPRK